MNYSQAHKCAVCGRKKGEHQADTLHCPTLSKYGRRDHRLIGWKTTVFVPSAKAPPEPKFTL